MSHAQQPSATSLTPWRRCPCRSAHQRICAPLAQQSLAGQGRRRWPHCCCQHECRAFWQALRAARDAPRNCPSQGPGLRERSHQIRARQAHSPRLPSSCCCRCCRRCQAVCRHHRLASCDVASACLQEYHRFSEPWMRLQERLQRLLGKVSVAQRVHVGLRQAEKFPIAAVSPAYIASGARTRPGAKALLPVAESLVQPCVHQLEKEARSVKLQECSEKGSRAEAMGPLPVPPAGASHAVVSATTALCSARHAGE